MEQRLQRTWMTSIALVALIIALGILTSGVGTAQSAGPIYDEIAQAPVGGKVEAENGCYVRLPDLPAVRYGGFGAYSDDGVLTYAGGAEKLSADNTYAYHQLYAIKLDGSMTDWNLINYSNSVGYLREPDKGCREMSSVKLPSGNWLSVGGKDGCEGGSSDGDIKELQVGDKATASGVRWVTNSRADPDSLPPSLADGDFKLLRNFATYDTERNRLVFGQGTFDDAKDTESQDQIYEATKTGSLWRVKQLRPNGSVPVRRFSSCGAYVYDKDTGVDGVLVLGGQQGGTVSTTSYKEVWWLDFSGGANGEWMDMTSRFANMDNLGYRRGGACAYDPDTKKFYSWMGRADSGVPDGAKRSSGAWRVDLTELGDDTKQLTWERLAKDKADDPMGRRLIPSVYDFANKRFFAIGGRNDLASYKDVWAFYPDVTGQACADLDPYAPHRPAVTATTPAPTAVPTQATPGGTPATPMPTVPPQPTQPGLAACSYLPGRAPSAVINDAMANPAKYSGFGMRCNPNVPASPWNIQRTTLGLQNPKALYHPLFNAPVWKCGCP